MIYFVYLASLCKRRSWPEPQFDALPTREGYIGVARVNNREYVSESVSATPQVAMEMAASQAYVICRNFSLNNGMYPDQRPNDAGLVQGLPVAIGTGRQPQHIRGKQRADYAQSIDGRSVTSDGSSVSDTRSASGSSSPTALVRCACGEAAHPGFDYCARCYHYRAQLQAQQQQHQQQQQQHQQQQQLYQQQQQQQHYARRGLKRQP